MTHTTPTRVTLEAIEAKIRDTQYTRVAGGTMTLCVVTMANGFQVTGESACVNPDHFDVTLGKQYARENALDKIWALEGYALKERQHQEAACTTPCVPGTPPFAWSPT